VSGSDSKRSSRSLRDQLAALPRPERKRAAKRPEAKAEEPVEVSNDATFAGLVGQVNAITKAPLQGAPPPVPRAAVRGEPQRAQPDLVVERDGERVRGFAAGVTSRLLAELASGRVLPEREIDLHGLRAASARSALTHAVEDARRDGLECLLVICGRGKHSESGPVLPDVAIERLSELGDHVLGFCTAPARLGGGGALLVRLRAAPAAAGRRRRLPS
jgi:DNA-nicking Smr family endonuclease